jgi:hypothetical protein
MDDFLRALRDVPSVSQEVTMHDLMKVMLIQWFTLMNRNPFFKFWFS